MLLGHLLSYRKQDQAGKIPGKAYISGKDQEGKDQHQAKDVPDHVVHELGEYKGSFWKQPL